MAKRKAQNAFSIENSSEKRVTRSAAAIQSSVIVNASGALLPRKKRRGPQPKAETASIVTTPKRVYGRRVAEVAKASSHKENSVSDSEKGNETEDDELNLGRGVSQCAREEDVPRKAKKRVVFDSVEIVTPVRPTRTIPIRERATTPTPASAGKRSSLKKSPVKPAPSPAPSKPFQEKPVRFKHAVASEPAITSPKQLPKPLPQHLHKCLDSQKRAILDTFCDPPLIDCSKSDEDDESPANIITLQQLGDLLGGTIERGEGNSCVVIGPSGSGKSKVFEYALSKFEEDFKPIVIRLNGHVQHTDRLAMREIARQVVQQTGSKKFESISSEDNANPFIDDDSAEIVSFLPPPAHLPSLIAALPTLSRPVILLLDAFDLFVDQPRQALLYCLLDTVQSCRVGTYTQRGLAVIGLTTRVDVVNFLEKRVKSRFSHRLLRTAGTRKVDIWIALLKDCLCTSAKGSSANSLDPYMEEWRATWVQSVSLFLEDRALRDILKDVFGISRDVRLLLRVMTNVVVRLSPSAPYLSATSLRIGIDSQRSKPQSALLLKLNYSSLSLLIAAQHVRTAGHDTFTFEMLYELFAIQVRTSSAAPVMLGGGGIGMVSVGRRVMMGVFEDLVRMRIFLQTMVPSANTANEFVKHRCVVERMDVKTAVERVGQTSLKKWLSKAQ